jgi:hypothetical protein
MFKRVYSMGPREYRATCVSGGANLRPDLCQQRGAHTLQ